MKAKHFDEVKKFSDIPNVGLAMVRDFKLLGISTPKQLTKKDPYKLYKIGRASCRERVCLAV